MDATDAFLTGFMLKCAEDGLTPEESLARADEAIARHEAGLLKVSFMTADGVINGISSGTANFLGSAVGTGLVGGAALGGLAAMAQPDDPLKSRRHPMLDELERADLINAFNTDTATLQRQLDAIARRRARQKTMKASPYGI